MESAKVTIELPAVKQAVIQTLEQNYSQLLQDMVTKAALEMTQSKALGPIIKAEVERQLPVIIRDVVKDRVTRYLTDGVGQVADNKFVIKIDKLIEKFIESDEAELIARREVMSAVFNSVEITERLKERMG